MNRHTNTPNNEDIYYYYYYYYYEHMAVPKSSPKVCLPKVVSLVIPAI